MVAMGLFPGGYDASLRVLERTMAASEGGVRRAGRARSCSAASRSRRLNGGSPHLSVEGMVQWMDG